MYSIRVLLWRRRRRRRRLEGRLVWWTRGLFPLAHWTRLYPERARLAQSLTLSQFLFLSSPSPSSLTTKHGLSLSLSLCLCLSLSITLCVLDRLPESFYRPASSSTMQGRLSFKFSRFSATSSVVHNILWLTRDQDVEYVGDWIVHERVRDWTELCDSALELWHSWYHSTFFIRHKYDQILELVFRRFFFVFRWEVLKQYLRF